MFDPGAGRWLACLTLCLVCAATRAQAPLTLELAHERALAGNPLLAAEAAANESAAARAELDGLPPPLTLGMDVENFAGSGNLSGIDSAETTLRLGRTLELGGKPAARRAVAAATLAGAAGVLDLARRDVIVTTTLRYLEVVADERRLALSLEEVALAETTRREVERVVLGARNPETDLRAAELSVADAELGREHAEHELASARVTLASTWGAYDVDFGETRFALQSLPEPEPLPELDRRLAHGPQLRAAEFEQALLDSRLKLAVTQSKTDLALGLGIRRLEAFEDHGLVMSLSMPLGSSTRGRLARAAARADVNAGAHRRAALLADSRQRLFEKYQELLHARTEQRALTESMLPKARDSLKVAQRGFDAGRFPFTTLAQSQRTLFELRRREIDVAARYHVLFAEIGHLTTAGAP